MEFCHKHETIQKKIYKKLNQYRNTYVYTNTQTTIKSV